MNCFLDSLIFGEIPNSYSSMQNSVLGLVSVAAQMGGQSKLKQHYLRHYPYVDAYIFYLHRNFLGKERRGCCVESNSVIGQMVKAS